MCFCEIGLLTVLFSTEHFLCVDESSVGCIWGAGVGGEGGWRELGTNLLSLVIFAIIHAYYVHPCVTHANISCGNQFWYVNLYYAWDDGFTFFAM